MNLGMHLSDEPKLGKGQKNYRTDDLKKQKNGQFAGKQRAASLVRFKFSCVISVMKLAHRVNAYPCVNQSDRSARGRRL